MNEWMIAVLPDVCIPRTPVVIGSRVPPCPTAWNCPRIVSFNNSNTCAEVIPPGFKIPSTPLNCCIRDMATKNWKKEKEKWQKATLSLAIFSHEPTWTWSECEWWAVAAGLWRMGGILGLKNGRRWLTRSGTNASLKKPLNLKESRFLLAFATKCT